MGYIELKTYTRDLSIILYFQIDKNSMQTEGMVARVRREVEIHSRLKHPSILEVKLHFEVAQQLSFFLKTTYVIRRFW